VGLGREATRSQRSMQAAVDAVPFADGGASPAHQATPAMGLEAAAAAWVSGATGLAGGDRTLTLSVDCYPTPPAWLTDHAEHRWDEERPQSGRMAFVFVLSAADAEHFSGSTGEAAALGAYALQRKSARAPASKRRQKLGPQSCSAKHGVATIDTRLGAGAGERDGES